MTETVDVVSAKQLAEALGYGSHSPISIMAADGRLPAPGRFGRNMIWSRAQIERWLLEPVDSPLMMGRKMMAWRAFFGDRPWAAPGASARAEQADVQRSAAEAAGGAGSRPGDAPERAPSSTPRPRPSGKKGDPS